MNGLQEHQGLVLCIGCPTNPPCGGCPNRVKHVSLASAPVKRVRVPFDPNSMGFGVHRWEYIDKNSFDIEEATTPPGGVGIRDFNCAFNTPHPESNVDMDAISRIGTVISSTFEPLVGDTWEVVEFPFRRGSEHYTRLKSEQTEQVLEVRLYDLGLTLEIESNLYNCEVVTKREKGGRANSHLLAAKNN